MEIHLDDPWYDLVARRVKSVEGRLASPKWAAVGVNSIWTIVSNDDRRITARVDAVRRYDSLTQYLKTEGLERTLPGIGSIDEGVAVYERYYPRGQDEILGVLAFEIAII
jgi:ASC-1-like (ASCH) protein